MMYMYNLMKVCSPMMTCLMRNGIQTPTMKKKYIVMLMFQAQIRKKKKDLSSNDESIGDLGDKD